MPNGSTWNMEVILQHFGTSTAQAISKVHIGGYDEEDTLIWRPSSNGIFTSKSMYKYLADLRTNTALLPVIREEFPWNKIWASKGIQPKVLYFIWRALHKGIPVGERLMKFNGGQGMCCRCSDIIEMVDHLLIHFPFAKEAWDRSFTSTLVPRGPSLRSTLSDLLLGTGEEFKLADICAGASRRPETSSFSTESSPHR